jgi:kynurenine 3-monooxygenase
MEMSSKTADDKSSCKRKLKNGFQTSTLISGFHFIVVTFSDRPYAEALAIGDEQNEIMEHVLKTEKTSVWDSRLLKI